MFLTVAHLHDVEEKKKMLKEKKRVPLPVDYIFKRMCVLIAVSNGFVLIFEQEHTVLNNRDFAFLLPIAIFHMVHQLFT